MAENLVRFGISMERQLLDRFDAVVQRKGYHTRSEAVRDLVRSSLVEAAWQTPDADVVGTVTLVYDHHQRGLCEHLTNLQHGHHQLVRATTHMHLDTANCLEVIVVKGPAAQVQHLADELISSRGVKHGRLVATTTGVDLG